MVRCKNCEHTFEGNFCPNCGQNAHEHRINLYYFIHDIPHSIFHVDGAFFSTLKGLFTKPGVVIGEFLEGKRMKYFRPFAYVMVMTAICTLLVKILDYLKLKLILYYDPSYSLQAHGSFFEHYFSVFIFLMIPFASLVTWLFFFKNKYNFWEHFLANTYIGAQLNLILILTNLINIAGILISKQNFEVNFTLSTTLFMMLFLYLYGRVFGYLMHTFYNQITLILLLTIMNLVLFYLYSFGLQLAGIN